MENLIVGVTEQKINISKFGILLFLFGMIILENGSATMKVVKILVFGLAVIVAVRRHYIANSTYIVWLSLYSAYACMTTLWAVDNKTAAAMSQTLVLNLLCLWAYVQFINKKDRYIKLSCKAMTVFPIIAFITIAAEHGMSTLTSIRNLEGEQSSLHNAIGLHAAFAICLIIALKDKGENYKYDFFEKTLVSMNLLVVALSGSRKAIIYLAIPLFVFSALKSRNPIKIIKSVLFAVCAAIIVYVALMKVPALYNMIGEGLQTMIAGLKGNESDASTSARVRIISWGFEVFKERPFWGHGLENFKILHLYRFGQMYIADNNYIELLVDQGMVGLLLYYSFHVWLIKNFISVIKKNKNNRFLIMLFGMEIATIVCDYGVVSYRSMYLQILICTMAIALQNVKQRT